MYGVIQKSYQGSSQRSEIKFPYLFTYSLLAGDSHDEAKKFLLSQLFLPRRERPLLAGKFTYCFEG